jgi:hypothetical protein
MPDATLPMLAKEVRTNTLTMLERLSDEQASFALLNNSILWHAGHMLVVTEHLCILPLTRAKAGYPDGWFATFSWKSNPLGVTQWPTIEQVRIELRSQLARLMTALERATDEQLDALSETHAGRTIRWQIIHGLHDEARHQGEIWLLRKVQAKGK